jgi:hypothetical protein
MSQWNAIIVDWIGVLWLFFRKKWVVECTHHQVVKFDVPVKNLYTWNSLQVKYLRYDSDEDFSPDKSPVSFFFYNSKLCFIKLLIYQRANIILIVYYFSFPNCVYINMYKPDLIKSFTHLTISYYLFIWITFITWWCLLIQNWPQSLSFLPIT